MQIRILAENEKNSIRPLYEEVFNDSQYFVDYYFNRYVYGAINFVCEENGKIVGMATIHPKTIIVSDKAYKAGYVYAVATKESHRGKGIMKEILKVIDKYAYDRKYDYLYLIPVNPDIYVGQGYALLRKKSENVVNVEKNEDICVIKISVDDIEKCVEFAEKTYKNKVSLLCDEAYLSENIKRLSIKNSGIYCIFNQIYDRILGLAFVDVDEDVTIENIVCNEEYENICINALCNSFDVSTLTYKKNDVMFKEINENLNNLTKYSICINDEI